MAMTPGRKTTSGATPQRVTPRSSSQLPGRVRRALDGSIDSQQRYGDSVKVAEDGRVEVNVVDGGGLKMTKQGLMVDLEQVGEKNRPVMNRVADPESTAATDVYATVLEILAELRRTGNMRR